MSLAAAGSWCALYAARAARHKPSEYQVEAVYLLNFGRFVKWPLSSNSEFSICVLGENPFQGQLSRTVSGENIGGKPVRVRHIWSSSQARGCAILFISESERSRASSILDDVANQPTLTVSDMPHFLEAGGMVQFVIEDDRVRFAVNRDPAHDAGIVMSSDLLKVATRVEGR